MVLTKVGNDIVRSWRGHDGRKQAFNLVPSLLYGVDVALGWTTLEARPCENAMNAYMSDIAISHVPWKVQAFVDRPHY
jgi:hypothetical protein